MSEDWEPSDSPEPGPLRLGSEGGLVISGTYDPAARWVFHWIAELLQWQDVPELRPALSAWWSLAWGVSVAWEPGNPRDAIASMLVEVEAASTRAVLQWMEAGRDAAFEAAGVPPDALPGKPGK